MYGATYHFCYEVSALAGLAKDAEGNAAPIAVKLDVQFAVFQMSEEDYDKGWSISYSESLIIGRNETFDVPVKIFSPITDDYIDEWMLCTIKVTIRSLPEPMGSILNETATITAHCLS